jgi:phosphoglycerate-specific signal transduction histidine kinase
MLSGKKNKLRELAGEEKENPIREALKVILLAKATLFAAEKGRSLVKSPGLFDWVRKLSGHKSEEEEEADLKRKYLQDRESLEIAMEALTTCLALLKNAYDRAKEILYAHTDRGSEFPERAAEMAGAANYVIRQSAYELNPSCLVRVRTNWEIRTLTDPNIREFVIVGLNAVANKNEKLRPEIENLINEINSQTSRLEKLLDVITKKWKPVCIERGEVGT